MTSKDAVNDPRFQMALEKQLNQETCIGHAFPAEDEAERVDELGVLDDPDIQEAPQSSPDHNMIKILQVQLKLRECSIKKEKCWKRYPFQICRWMSVREENNGSSCQEPQGLQ